MFYMHIAWIIFIVRGLKNTGLYIDRLWIFQESKLQRFDRAIDNS